MNEKNVNVSVRLSDPPSPHSPSVFSQLTTLEEKLMTSLEMTDKLLTSLDRDAKKNQILESKLSSMSERLIAIENKLDLQTLEFKQYVDNKALEMKSSFARRSGIASRDLATAYESDPESSFCQVVYQPEPGLLLTKNDNHFMVACKHVSIFE